MDEKVNRRMVKRLICFGVGATAFFIAAPAIGTLAGVYILGWSGCVATSSGLALLGGGSLASGGMGMEGGKAVITLIGGIVGDEIGSLLPDPPASDEPNQDNAPQFTA